jgi:hypothetical protein
VTDLNKLFKWLTILSTLIALFVFLFSVVSSFYDWSFTLLETSSATYWSYRANYYFLSLGIHSWQYAFFNYWFNANNQGEIGFLGMSWIPLAMFVMQLLTLCFGCASLVINKRIIRSVPVGSSLAVLALMFYVGYRLSSSNNNGAGYQLGYYLVYPSLVLFALAFALNEVRARYLQSKESKPRYRYENERDLKNLRAVYRARVRVFLHNIRCYVWVLFKFNIPRAPKLAKNVEKDA